MHATTLPTAAVTPARSPRRHARLPPYRRLIAAAVLVNVGVLAHLWSRGGWRIDDGSALSTLSTMTLANLTVAVLVRQQAVLNVVYGLAGRGSRSWPLRVRWGVANVHHIGGLHVGCALAGTASLGAFTVVAIGTRVRHPEVVPATTAALSTALAGLLLVVCICAAPWVRTRAHDVFERSHRWGGWASVALFWALTIDLDVEGRGDVGALHAIASDPRAWALLLITASIAAPWVRLRRVPVRVERPSAHVAIVHLDDVRPAGSSAVGISRRPLVEWHPFATVTTPGRPGCRLFVARAGDWTSRFIDDPPTHVWVRGRPVSAPMAKVAPLFERVVYVVTGSGIGPSLGQLLTDRVPARLVWSTRHPRRTYGDALVDEIEAAQPDAVIWDTTTAGTPDLLGLACEAVDDVGAEAVFVVSNKPTTLGLVRDLERRGIRTFGPIWDS
ncbi:MAG: hypothetical protein ABW122_13515 [Ilumatobacteraceae bacterium]